MGFLKKIERSSKRTLMRALSRIVRTEKRTAESIRKSGPKRILIIRQHNQMGDMVLAIPAFRAVKESVVGCKLGVVTSMINRDVLVNNPYVDYLYVYQKKNPFSILSMIFAMRRVGFDLVIVLNTVSFSFTSAVLALLSGARLRVGSSTQAFGTRIGSSFYNLELPLPSEEELLAMNETEHNLYPLASLGITTDDLSPLIAPPEGSKKWADELVAEYGRSGEIIIVVHPGAGKKENIWHPEKFAAVVDRIHKKKPTCLFVVQGPRDEGTVETFTRAVAMRSNVLAKRSIGDIAAVMKRAHLVLCNDTGTMHVSCAVGASTLAIFGPTGSKRWAPKCGNLYTIQAPDGRLQSLTEEIVYRKAVEILA
jgi:ADP-heptose:LPS heptosyltransferase